MDCNQVCGLEALSSREKLLLARLTYVLFGVLSLHLVLVALWLIVGQHGRALFFGQWEELSEAKNFIWAVFLLYCGVNGLLMLAAESKLAAVQAHLCWLLLSVFHCWYLVVGIIPSTKPSWPTWEMAVQLLTDVMSVSFLTWHLRQIECQDSIESFNRAMQEPLLPYEGYEEVST